MKIDFNKIRLLILKIPWLAAKNAFLACLFIFFVALVLGVVLFYKNYRVVENSQSKEIVSEHHFDEVSYKRLIEYWKRNEEDLNRLDTKEFPNLFILKEVD